ncbi:hypothetical protein FJ420_17160 [Mesorhizobium sp. B3-1-3]|uniref:hypothetical protein n=1 Tax=unclassified Mesorhizobium TaxID=325217 RepID=UPI00112D9D08|nr:MULTISPECIES: hypothetical protein [unclassified Mesorhizobium]TPI64259.1 hypothetical protein FJ424_18000 [Mesorhizobium sp. B3-1-8]TPI70261.1 hypothetical protein FJ420_17160 [Mesorhizobium sp. B3-1-3]
MTDKSWSARPKRLPKNDSFAWPPDCDEALSLIRMAIEMTCPAGVLPSREMVNGLYGPEPIHEAEALAKAIIATVEKLTG